jgi:hypothetical protein
MQTINISDSPEGYKRKVEIIGWGCNEETPGYESVYVNTMCRHYQNNAGAYGDLIETQRIKSFRRDLSASMQRFVDPSDGMDLTPETYLDPEIIYHDVMQPIPVEDQVEGGPTEELVQVPETIHISKVRYRRKDNNEIVASPVKQFEFFNQLTYTTINIRTLIQQIVYLEDVLHHSYDK